MTNDFREPTDEEIAALTRVEYKRDAQSDIAEAERILSQAAPIAARTLVDLCANGINERIRLQAAQYIVDRNFGRITDAGSRGGDDPLQSILGVVLREPSREEL
jgi:hypothetical protein